MVRRRRGYRAGGTPPVSAQPGPWSGRSDAESRGEPPKAAGSPPRINWRRLPRSSAKGGVERRGAAKGGGGSPPTNQLAPSPSEQRQRRGGAQGGAAKGGGGSPPTNQLAPSPAEPRQRRGGAGDGLRTRYLNLGKVALYRVSYSRASYLMVPRPSRETGAVTRRGLPPPADSSCGEGRSRNFTRGGLPPPCGPLAVRVKIVFLIGRG